MAKPLGSSRANIPSGSPHWAEIHRPSCLAPLSHWMQEGCGIEQGGCGSWGCLQTSLQLGSLSCREGVVGCCISMVLTPYSGRRLTAIAVPEELGDLNKIMHLRFSTQWLEGIIAQWSFYLRGESRYCSLCVCLYFPSLYVLNYFFIVLNIHNIKCTMLANFKCTVQWH